MTDEERTLRLTHPGLEFYVDLRLREHTEGMWIATADLGEDRDVGMSRAPREAIRRALVAVGEKYAREMARDAELEGNDDD